MIDNINGLNKQTHSKVSQIYIFNNLAPSQQNISKLKKLNLSQNSGIIFISDENNIENKIFALEHYVDIYLTQPFEIRELNAHITSLYRRIKPEYNLIRQINIKNKVLTTLDNRMLSLSKIDFIILHLLSNQSKTIVTKSAIAKQLDISTPDYHKQINTIMCRLRKKLLNFDEDLVIQTIRETGYTYTGPAILIE